MPYTPVYRNPVTKVVTVTNAFYAKEADDVLMTSALDHDPTGDDEGSAGTHTLFSHVQELFFKARLHDVENYSIVTNDAVDPG